MAVKWISKSRHISYDGVATEFYNYSRTVKNGFSYRLCFVNNGFPTSGGGSAVTEATSTNGDGISGEATDDGDDDDGGDGDSDPARSRQQPHPSHPPAHSSASPKHTVIDRSRTQRQQSAEKTKAFEVIGVSEFDIAESIGMSVEFLRKDRSGKRLIPFYRIGKSIRYSPHRVIQALATLEEGGHAPRPKAKKSANSLSAG
jgi:hypothetical protein